jgi:hypothetical protein
MFQLSTEECQLVSRALSMLRRESEHYRSPALDLQKRIDAYLKERMDNDEREITSD